MLGVKINKFVSGEINKFVSGEIKNWGPFFIIFAAFLWSLDGILRRSLYILPPAIIVFYEHLLGALVLSPILLKSLKSFAKLPRKTLGAVVWVSLFGGLLGTFFYTAALGKVQYINFSVVVLLQQLQPIFAIALAGLVLKETIRPKFLRWAALALFGAYLVSFPQLRVNFVAEREHFIAAMLALGAAFAWGSSTVFGRVGLKKLQFQALSALRFFITSVFALVFIFLLGNQAALGSVTPPQWLTLLVITFSTGMVAIIIYYYGLRTTPARVSTICEMFWPVSAIFIDFFFFQKTLSSTQWLGTAVLLFAIYQVSLARKQAELKK